MLLYSFFSHFNLAWMYVLVTHLLVHSQVKLVGERWKEWVPRWSEEQQFRSWFSLSMVTSGQAVCSKGNEANFGWKKARTNKLTTFVVSPFHRCDPLDTYIRSEFDHPSTYTSIRSSTIVILYWVMNGFAETLVVVWFCCVFLSNLLWRQTSLPSPGRDRSFTAMFLRHALRCHAVLYLCCRCCFNGMLCGGFIHDWTGSGVGLCAYCISRTCAACGW